jgi:hypothetical protein
MPLSGGTSFPPEASPNSLIAEKDSALVVVGQRIRNNVAQIGDRLLSCRCRNRTDGYRRLRCWPWRSQLAATGDMELAALC